MALHRLAPELPLPPYAYVPGGPHPHPTRDPAGHSYGRLRPAGEPLDPAHWEACRLYRYGLDLFNHGYYWEAHEAWEVLWHACGRCGVSADFLKALIALAAAGVKRREGRARGAQRHAQRAEALLDSVAQRLGPGALHYLGLELGALTEAARRLVAGESVTAQPLTPCRSSRG